MKRLSQFLFIAMAGLLMVFSSCREDQYDMGELVAPTNLTITHQIVGADAENPFGDGTGFVNFTATASNAITYTFDFGDGSSKVITGSGKVTKRFSITGITAYNVTVQAVGTGGILSSKSTQLEVLSTFEDPQAVEFLTGGSSKTWYWASDQPGHTGLGPTSEDNGNQEFTYAAWWSIQPNDPDKACMYTAEFVFTKTEMGMSFEQTTGPAFVPGTYAGKIGVEGDVCHDETVATSIYGVKNIALSPSSSLAAEVGQYRGTTMTFSNDGFMCWWVGSSEYDIIEVTENILRVRIKEDDTFSWYHTFTSVKPE
ncbi:MAG: hypothetical protein IH597_10485 [Bacteroidales bacterium]|nr:hypothetical protein [Bacteroidales bacterium]